MHKGRSGEAVFFTFTIPMPGTESQCKRQSQTNHKGENDDDGIVVRIDFHLYLYSQAFELIDTNAFITRRFFSFIDQQEALEVWHQQEEQHTRG